MAKPLLDKLGGGKWGGRRGEHGQSEERVVRKSRLGPNSLSNKCARQDTGHPSATAIPRGRKFPSLQNICLDVNFFSFGENPFGHFSKNIATRNWVEKLLHCCHRHRPVKAVLRGPIPRDHDCIATVVRSAGIYRVKQSARKATGDLQKLAGPCCAFWFTKGLGRSSHEFSRMLHLVVTSEPVSITWTRWGCPLTASRHTK